MIKGYTHQENKYLCSCNYIPSKYIRQTFPELKGKRDKYIIIGDVNIPFSYKIEYANKNQ